MDELWAGGPAFIQSEAAFPLGTDAVLLGNFVNLSRVRTICDLGCGSGVIAILLAMRDPKVCVDGVEIMPQAADVARENGRINGLCSRFRVFEADLRDFRQHFSAGAYDLVVTNPPYFRQGSGKAVADPVTAAARDERSCTLLDVLTAAAWLLRWGGRFALVHRPERLAEVICGMESSGIAPKRLRMVQCRTDSAPNLILIEGIRGGNPGISIEPPLILTDPDGNDTEEVRKIYHRL